MYERFPGGHPPGPILKLLRGTLVPAAPPSGPVSVGSMLTRANELSGSMWAITGKQYWRSGVIRKRMYGARVLTHLQSPQRMSTSVDSRAVAMKVGIRYGVCNNSPAELVGSKNG